MNASVAALRRRLARATHRLDAVPAGRAWNERDYPDLFAELGELRHAAVLVPIVPRSGGPRVILTRRNERMRTHAGQISFPGGRLEPDDLSPLETALRETWEEIGLPASSVDPVGYLDPYATITGFRVSPVVGIVRPGFTLKLDSNEVDEAFEVPLEFLLDPANCETRSREFRGRIRHYQVYAWHGRDIWGATASMLQNLSRRWHAVRRR
jgi:8-oxo-dGTP pyrophosphatase MutT (NUDIX family)